MNFSKELLNETLRSPNQKTCFSFVVRISQSFIEQFLRKINFYKMPSNVCLWCYYFCRWATFVICLMTYMNEIALLGFFLHVKCWYRMFCVALFFEIHLTSAYFGRNLSFDIFFLISMEPFWIESTVSPAPEIVCNA